MPKVYGQVEVACPVAKVYEYLKGRYQGDTFRSICMMNKGYVPEVIYVQEQENKRLVFRVAGCDSLLRIKTGSWQWSYELSSHGEDRTTVAITYEWSIFFSLMSFFTVRHQAANELIETALALDALSANKTSQPTA